MSGAFRFSLTILAVVTLGCGRSTAQLASIANPLTPLTGEFSLSGLVIDAASGKTVSSGILTLTGPGHLTTVAIDSEGRFATSGIPAAIISYSVSAPGYLEHHSALAVTGSKSDIVLSVISTTGSFSLATYRQFARNGYDSTVLQPLKRWSISPSFYVRTIVSDTGETVPASIVDGIHRIFVSAVPELSGGRFQVAAFTSGEELREVRDGWVNVEFVHSFSDQRGGEADVGPVNGGGHLRLRYDPSGLDAPDLDPYACGSRTISTADHEIVHTMGFYHTDQSGLDFHSGIGCPGNGRPSRVRDMALVVYSRPAGNLDADQDPLSFVSASAAVQPTGPLLIACPDPLRSQRVFRR